MALGERKGLSPEELSLDRLPPIVVPPVRSLAHAQAVVHVPGEGGEPASTKLLLGDDVMGLQRPFADLTPASAYFAPARDDDRTPHLAGLLFDRRTFRLRPRLDRFLLLERLSLLRRRR